MKMKLVVFFYIGLRILWNCN